ncbi:MAG: hypothetical protein EOO16_18605 [Chitinophagaceae bacterium]|nr:MAG: hypothetical protein EOO16_18605 [Chitinophagaceae bacterium]
MRKLILTALLAAGSTALFAQKSVDKAQEKLKDNNLEEARAEIEKAAADPKAATNSDYWFTRARIYNAMSRGGSDTAALHQALVAMQHYVDLQSDIKDENKQYVASMLDNGHKTAQDIYNSHFTNGVKTINAKQYPLSEYYFANALAAFDYLKKAKLITTPFDTTSTLYAGYAAESAEHPDVAARYYGIIADHRVADTTMIGVYQYLVRHYSAKKDAANKDKYMALGKELFPKDPWWNAWDLQSVQGDKPAKIAQYAEMFKKDPKNMDVAETYVVELFNYIYKDAPADALKRQDDLTAAIETILANNPTDLRWNHIYTQHLTYRTGDLETAAKAVKGTKPEDVKKKQELNKQVAMAYDAMLAQSLKEAALYEGKELSGSDKANFKFVINSIVAAYQYKKNDAEAKKWDAKSKTIK